MHTARYTRTRARALPGVANCVGAWNRKAFVLFVLNAWAGSTFLALTWLPRVAGGLRNYVAMTAWVMSVSFSITLTCFGAMHLYLMVRARTTIEFGHQPRQGILRPWDFGAVRNAQAILGSGSVWKRLSPRVTMDVVLASAQGTWLHSMPASRAARAFANLPARIQDISRGSATDAVYMGAHGAQGVDARGRPYINLPLLIPAGVSMPLRARIVQHMTMAADSAGEIVPAGEQGLWDAATTTAGAVWAAVAGADDDSDTAEGEEEDALLAQV